MESAIFRSMYSEKTALLLQQIRIPSQRNTVMLCCVSEALEKERAGAFCGDVLDFFREHFFERDFESTLKRYMAEAAKAGGEVSFASLLCTNFRAEIWGMGSVRVYLVNRFFNRIRVRRIGWEGQDEFGCVVESGVGIFLASGQVWKRIKEDEMGKCFDGLSAFKGGKAEKALKERMEALCGKCGKEKDAAAAAVWF